MKKAFLALALLFSCTVFSQTQIGIKGGLNINDISDSRYRNNTATRLGYHGGLLFHIHVQRKLAVQPEVVFSSQGAK
ncbi:MAG: PorT family protein, partial [Chitinophagaceae bacterium]